jgi:DNA replication and repair protein RecF
MFNELTSKILGFFRKEKLSIKLEVSISNKEKKIKKNNTKIKKFSNYISNLNVIMFTPDDLEIIKGSPNDRRKFLNIEIGQLNNNYINLLNKYNALLKNRNEYLKNIFINKLSDFRYLEAITEKLVDLATKIYLCRKDFILKINDELKKIYKEITKKNINIKYNGPLEILNLNESEIKEGLIKQFNNIREKEINYGSTLIGPHKDDLIFLIDDEKEIKKYSSQGQQRAAVLALKLAEIKIFFETTNFYPILLLDDVFSELDEIKKNILLKKINKKIQTIITTTSLSNINTDFLKKATIFKVSNANVEKIDEVKDNG